MVIKERVTFCDAVSQPILSFGRLMKMGWSIDGGGQCLRNGILAIPLAFQSCCGKGLCSHVECHIE